MHFVLLLILLLCAPPQGGLIKFTVVAGSCIFVYSSTTVTVTVRYHIIIYIIIIQMELSQVTVVDSRFRHYNISYHLHHHGRANDVYL